MKNMKKWCMPPVLVSWGSLLVGCDEAVRDTVIDGLQNAATVLVTSLFTALFQILGA